MEMEVLKIKIRTLEELLKIFVDALAKIEVDLIYYQGIDLVDLNVDNKTNANKVTELSAAIISREKFIEIIYNLLSKYRAEEQKKTN